MCREGDHRFEPEEQVVDGVDGSLFQISIAVGNVITGVEGCWSFEEPSAKCSDGVGWGTGEREASHFDEVDGSAGVFEESVNVITFRGWFVLVFLGVGENGVGVQSERSSLVVSGSSVEWSLVEKGVNEVDREVGSDGKFLNNNVEDCVLSFGWDRIGRELWFEKIFDGCVCSTKGADVLVKVLLVVWVFLCDDSQDAGVSLKSRFRNFGSCGDDLARFEFIREGDDSSGRDAIVGQVIKITGEVKLGRESLMFGFVTEDVFDRGRFRLVAEVGFFVGEGEFERPFDTVEIGVVVDLESRTRIFRACLENFPIALEMCETFVEVVTNLCEDHG